MEVFPNSISGICYFYLNWSYDFGDTSLVPLLMWNNIPVICTYIFVILWVGCTWYILNTNDFVVMSTMESFNYFGIYFYFIYFIIFFFRGDLLHCEILVYPKKYIYIMMWLMVKIHTIQTIWMLCVVSIAQDIVYWKFCWKYIYRP